MKMNIIKHIATVAIPAALLLTGPTAPAQNYAPGSYRVVDGIAFNKHVTDNHNGTFTVDLESFVTGKVHTETEKVPADVVLILDLSTSMDYDSGTAEEWSERKISNVYKPLHTNDKPMGAANKTMTAVNPTGDGWRYNDFPAPAAAYPQYFFLKDGIYYQVKRETLTAPARYLFYVDLPEGKRYLYGDAPTATAPTVAVAAADRVYKGELYTGGWKSSDITAATTAGGHYILYEGKYYPLLKSGSQVYFVYNGSNKYLSINGISDTTPSSVTNAYSLVYIGDLYRGGWSYGNITNGTSAGGHYYKYGDEYYPVIKETVSGNYQAYININGEKQYLSGDALSGTAPAANDPDLVLYYGKLYTGGWTYANITAGGNSAANRTLFYKHSDDKFYPVEKKQEGSIYQAYVVLPEGTKYLNPSGNLTNTPYPSATTTNNIVYSGALYKGWRPYDIDVTGADRHYFLHDGEYYPISKEAAANGYQPYITIPGTGKRYITLEGLSETLPTERGNYTTQYMGSLYQNNREIDREEGLKRAVRSFIAALEDKSHEDGLNHRLAIVQFNSAPSGFNVDKPTLLASSPIDNSASHVVVDFVDVTTTSGVNELLDAFPNDDIDFTGLSKYYTGYAITRGLLRRELGDITGTDINGDGLVQDYEYPTLSGDDHDNYSKRPKIIITIGDFELLDDVSPARTEVNKLKAIENTSLVSVQVRPGTSATYDGYAKEFASSEDLYYKVEKFDEELIETLMTITEDIGGAELDVDGTVVTVDVVSQAFNVPTGSDVSAPKVYIAPLTGNNGASWDPAPATTGGDDEFVYYTFGPEVLQGEGSGITLTEGDDGHGNTKLTVEGFDYSLHWCGPDNKSSQGYHEVGQKLILRFTVVPNEDAVGGPAVQTNTDESGIYVDGEKIATFNQPTVSLPVNLWIEKKGLEGDDSAVFTIYYADPSKYPDGTDPHSMTYESFTKVIVHASDLNEDAMVKITGLDSKFYYRIKEDAWAWSYDYQTGMIYTSDFIKNPIQFENTPKAVTVKHAESFVTNEFKEKE